MIETEYQICERVWIKRFTDYEGRKPSKIEKRAYRYGYIAGTTEGKCI